MKKKIKDLTLEEVFNYCEQRFDCENCPFAQKYTDCFGDIIFRNTPEYLDQEIEVEDDESKN